MLQQRLLRSFLAASKQTPALPTSRISPSASQPKVAFVASQQLASRRWYSAETEAKKEEVLKEQAEAQGAQETPKKDAAKEDPVQKELEAKKQENVDLTVRTIGLHMVRPSLADSLNRTVSNDKLPNIATSKSRPSVRSKQRETFPCNDSQRTY